MTPTTAKEIKPLAKLAGADLRGADLPAGWHAVSRWS